MRDRVLQEEEAVAINPGMLRDEFVGFPGQLAYFGERYALAVATAAAKAELLKDTEAEVYIELSGQKAERGLTEAKIAALVRVDPRVKLARDMSQQAEATKVRLQQKVMAPLNAKRDMLISIGAHQRAELAGDPIVRHARREDIGQLEERAYGTEGGTLRGR